MIHRLADQDDGFASGPQPLVSAGASAARIELPPQPPLMQVNARHDGRVTKAARWMPIHRASREVIHDRIDRVQPEHAPDTSGAGGASRRISPHLVHDTVMVEPGPPSDRTLVTFNAGSSTVKIGLFALGPAGPLRIARGIIDRRDDPLSLRVEDGEAPFRITLRERWGTDLAEIVGETFDGLAGYLDNGEIVAVGHRVVHGGDLFTGPVRLDDVTTEAIGSLTALAPLHQPHGLQLIRAVRKARPDLPQAASFDTAFHRTADPLARRFAIPRHLHDSGIKRYGFHGLSYRHIAVALTRTAPDRARGKVVVAHLGSGASLCGLDDGASRDTSMGFSTLDGIPMATRCGALDPGVMLHLLGATGRTLPDVEDLLYHRSGLLGVSGISSDARDLLQSEDEHAREAIDLFAFRIAGEVARIATTLGGLDALVFTAGIGENQPDVRARICERLGWLGLALDPSANAANRTVISRDESRVAAFVLPADEEQVIAEETCAVLAGFC